MFPGQAAPIRPDGGPWARRFPWLEAIFQSASASEGVDPTATQIAQPAIIAGCLAGLRTLAHFGVEATVAVGHSIGELAALHWAGGLDADGLLRLARGRGKAMAELSLPGGAMALIAGEADATEELLKWRGRGDRLSERGARMRCVRCRRRCRRDRPARFRTGSVGPNSAGIACVSLALCRPCRRGAARPCRP